MQHSQNNVREHRTLQKKNHMHKYTHNSHIVVVLFLMATNRNLPNARGIMGYCEGPNGGIFVVDDILRVFSHQIKTDHYSLNENALIGDERYYKGKSLTEPRHSPHCFHRF